MKKVNRYWTLPWKCYDFKIAKLNFLLKIVRDQAQVHLRPGSMHRDREKKRASMTVSKKKDDDDEENQFVIGVLTAHTHAHIQCSLFHIYGVNNNNTNILVF